MSKKINKPRLFRNIILLFLIAGCIGLYISNRYIKTKGFDGLGDFINTYQSNKNLAEEVEAEIIQLKISDKDYAFLKNKRQEALNRGIQINVGDNYVDCYVIYKGDTLDGEMRLKGHMTDHLEGDKWSFRVKTEGEVLGMYRFSLQNPATRNYAYEWVYHQLLARENVIHLKYDFVRLILNDQDLGIYAVEEHFGQHVPRDNNRPPGAIIRWNPELYWEGRIDEMDSLYLDQEYASYLSSFPEAYDRGVVRKEPELRKNYIQGAAMLEAFRRGERSVSEVFDIEKMASFHAVIDLVGGYHSLDWSDVKFFFNTDSKKIEPVGYESFSVRESFSIAGQRRPNDYASIGQNYHDQLFADTAFFSAYIKAIERICDEAYMRDFEQLIQPALNKKRGVLAEEFAYIKFSWDGYYENIELIRHNLELPKPLHAFLEKSNDSVVQIAVAPVSDFPIEILGLEMDGKDNCEPIEFKTIRPKPTDSFLEYEMVFFKHPDNKLKDLFIRAKIPGSKNIFKVPVSDIPSYKSAEMPNFKTNKDTANSPIVWLNDSLAVFKTKKVEINSPILIAKGQQLRILNGQELVFNGGQIFLEGKMNVYGSILDPVLISAKSDQSPILIKGGELNAIHSVFVNLKNGLIQAQNAKLSFDNCSFADVEAHLIMASLSEITAINSCSGKMNSLGNFDRSLVRIRNFHAINGDVLLAAKGSDIDIHTSSIEGYKEVARLDHGSSFSTWNSTFNENQLLVDLKNASVFNTFSCQINSGETGVHMDTTGLGKYSSYSFYKTTTINLKSVLTEG